MEAQTYFDAETWFQDDEKSIALIVLKGLNSKVRNRVSTTTYEVVSGSGRFSFGGADFEVKAGSRVTIPAGHTYQDQGDLVMLATSRPPFNPKQVEVIEEAVFRRT